MREEAWKATENVPLGFQGIVCDVKVGYVLLFVTVI